MLLSGRNFHTFSNIPFLGPELEALESPELLVTLLFFLCFYTCLPTTPTTTVSPISSRVFPVFKLDLLGLREEFFWPTHRKINIYKITWIYDTYSQDFHVLQFFVLIHFLSCFWVLYCFSFWMLHSIIYIFIWRFFEMQST